ncbi:hypothetical protein LXT13_12540 [Pelomonas sp. P8]|uniref:Uncharacterized protein n=2 Tax=Pelomonas cellulosilytica TaxID=2906762 RepID=A0ABS8XU86_9BURK|nr:hypothetical protein [Pelomonas sp. P8]
MPIALALFAAVLVGLTVWYFRRKPSRSEQSSSSGLATIGSQSAREAATEDAPARLVIGSDASHPVVAVEMLVDVTRFQRAEPVDASDVGISRLSALLQAVPSVLTAGEASGKRLMEVVVNGNLAQAADGNGMRGFVLGAPGIKEHARLFEADKLKHMINAAAVWQIASVIVAQKHLADINAKLTELADAVKGVSEFLELERRSVLSGTLDYLSTVARAVQAGELPSAVRGQLEASEGELTKVFRHLYAEYGKVVGQGVADTDTVGSQAVTEGLVRKMQRLERIASDIALCLRTRAAAWHVLCLYPGEPQLKNARRDAILAHVEAARSLPGQLDAVLGQDLERIKSMWNKQETLDARKGEVRRAATSANQLVYDKTDECRDAVARTDQLMLAQSQPMRLLFEVDGSEIVGVRREALPLAA